MKNLFLLSALALTLASCVTYTKGQDGQPGQSTAHNKQEKTSPDSIKN